MATKKRKSSTSSHDIDNDNDTNDNNGVTVKATVADVTKYVAGKNPRRSDFAPVIYEKPLQPNSELYIDNNWNIPEFNMFITYTIDNLIDLYKPIFKDFIKLPSRKFHPQYYYKVDQPMSLKEIKSRNYEYVGGCRDFLLDLELLAKNCNSFNEEDSLIVKNSYQVVNYVKYEMIKAKNIKKNYMINAEVKPKLMAQIDKLISSTEKEIIREINHGDKSGRNYKPSEPFLDFVDKDELPEYYEVIHKPMALNEVKENLEQDKYVTIYDCVIDILLTFDNAQVFNDEESSIYESAETLSRYINHLLERKFFPELQDAKERGEITLEYDKFSNLPFNGFTNPQGIGALNKVGEAGTMSAVTPFGFAITSEANDYDFNHFEGLGNGYSKNLLSAGGDYLLGPGGLSASQNLLVDGDNESAAPMNKKLRLDNLTMDSGKPDVLKFNILKSLDKTFVSKEHEIVKEPFKLINKLSVVSALSVYEQSVNPISNSRPPHSQNWLEYTFEFKDLNKNEKMYSLAVKPTQTYLTIEVNLNSSNLQNILEVNKTIIPSIREEQIQQNVLNGNSMIPNETQATVVGNRTPEKYEKYEIKLTEGMNSIKFQSADNTISEVFELWINVLP